MDGYRRASAAGFAISVPMLVFTLVACGGVRRAPIAISPPALLFLTHTYQTIVVSEPGYYGCLALSSSSENVTIDKPCVRGPGPARVDVFAIDRGVATIAVRDAEGNASSIVAYVPLRGDVLYCLGPNDFGEWVVAFALAAVAAIATFAFLRRRRIGPRWLAYVLAAIPGGAALLCGLSSAFIYSWCASPHSLGGWP